MSSNDKDEPPAKKQRLKQSTLPFVTSRNPDSASSACTKEHWSQKLIKYFTVITVSDAEKRCVMSCNLCTDKTIRDKGTTSFVRHLSRLHPKEYLEYDDETKKLKNQSVLSNVIAVKSSNSDSSKSKYSQNDHRQKSFEKRLLDFITLDSAPFTLLSGKGFTSLIHGIDERLSIPSPRTLGRHLETKFNEIVEETKKEINKLPPGCINLIIDIWSSLAKESVLGVKAKFIDSSWLIKTVILGFKHFPTAHTGDNIQNMIQEHVIKLYELNERKISKITADNASNVLAAFRIERIPLHASTAVNDLLDISTSLENSNDFEVELDGSYSQILLQEELLEANVSSDLEFAPVQLFEDDSEDSEDAETVVESSNEEFIFFKDKRNPCLAHLMQLVLKDAVERNAFAVEIVRKMNEIVSFFGRSNHFSSLLKSRSGGFCLVKPCTTRWNSQYDALKRIFGPKYIDTVLKAIEDTLREAKTKRNSTKVPSCFTDDEIEACKVMLILLQPLAIYTDRLQADGVTSSIVILGFVECVTRVESVSIDADLVYLDEMNSLKDNLLGSLLARFTSEVVPKFSTHEDSGKPRRIVTADILTDSSYILASILDPRIKTMVFDASIIPPSSRLFGKLCTGDTALNILKSLLSVPRTPNDSAEVQILDTGAESSTDPAQKYKNTSFSLLEKVKKKSSSANKDSLFTELECYLQDPEIDEKDDPLAYWKININKFPTLGEFARQYLAIPASSGSIERLFSVAISVARSKRASLKLKKLEMLLTYQQYLLNSLGRK